MIDYKLHTGPWNLTDLKDIPDNGLKVFSCFHCGGGSTMGYKLAGYDVVGGVEIDPKMMKIYRANHNPRYSYLMGIQKFHTIPNDQLPEQLFNLDILDGSPPCSSFSIAGSREKKWGVKKKFREGQADQILDDLFFDFIKVADKLKPKVVVAENVKGLIQGKAKGYVKQIYHEFMKAGYDCQLFLLNAAFMGVPQRRERTFFIARRRNLGLSKIGLEFNEKPISVKTAIVRCSNGREDLSLTETAKKYYYKCESGRSFASVHPKGSLFNWVKVDTNKPINTLASGNAKNMFHDKEPRLFSTKEWLRCQSFPEDFKYVSKYLMGMSVPPFMTQRIANQIYRQWYNGFMEAKRG